MVKNEVLKNELSLLITKATIESIEFVKNYSNEWVFRVSIYLYAGTKKVTNMYLRSDCDFDEPNYIQFDDKTRGALDRILSYIHSNANISLTRLAKQLNKPEEIIK